MIELTIVEGDIASVLELQYALWSILLFEMILSHGLWIGCRFCQS